MDDAHVFRRKEDTHPIDLIALGQYLDSLGMPIDREAGVVQFATGLANINYRLRISGQDVVLRRPPDGDLPPGAHDMKREHHILSRLSRIYNLAPDSLHLCEDTNVIGVPFQIMEYRPGRVIKGNDTSWAAGEPRLASQMGERLVDTMVSLHRVDVDDAGLGDFGRAEGFVGRSIRGWRQRAVRLEPPPALGGVIDEIGTWLVMQRTRDRAPTLLHCDIKLDNLILNPDTLEPCAIVDWDMGTRGDPLFDLATMLSYWTEASDPDCMHALAQMPTAAPGFQTRDEIVDLYARRAEVDVSDYHVFHVLCIFKLATVFCQLYALNGQRLAEYERFDRLGADLYEFAFEVMKGRV